MTDQPQGGKPALTVVIQSWWTPALAVIMLVVGLVAGYFVHPLLNKDTTASGDLAAATDPAVTAPIQSTPAETTPQVQITVPTSTVNPTMAAITNQEQLMAFLISNTDHFKGDPDAPVTIIEFSDYQ
jgi:protein-disulfide isomerase